MADRKPRITPDKVKESIEKSFKETLLPTWREWDKNKIYPKRPI